MKTIVVIGNGSMAVDCIKIMRGYGQVHVALVIADPKDISLMFLKQYCEAEALDLEFSNDVNSAEIVGKIKAIGPQIIFNINSFQIIREELIAVPDEGIINFHNGPLPRYRGINVCSWAIINGERRYGCTWHLIEKGIDSGDIVAQKIFEISETETAFSLIVKCIREGIALFAEFFPVFLAGHIAGISQNHSLASHYTRKDIPNDGFVDYGWNFARFDRFVRGLNFSPLQNRFAHPKSVVNSMDFYVRKISRCKGYIPETLEPGRVFRFGENGIDVKIKDYAISITEVLEDNMKPIRIGSFIDKYNLEVGSQMKPCGLV
ncbi:MAG TPA: formyltransferase family protein [Geobacteraceae bacterium]|nr:formyltransferase family protein [Geobacteraceae bacterium]